MNITRYLIFLCIICCSARPLQAITVHGSVFDAERRPIAHAKIIFQPRKPQKDWIAIISQELVTTRSNEKGIWKAEVPDYKNTPSSHPLLGVVIIAVPGKANAVELLRKGIPLQTQMQKSSPVGGVVQDLNGHPVAGVLVKAEVEYAVASPDLDDNYEGSFVITDKVAGLTTRSDSHGRWHLDGMSPSSNVGLSSQENISVHLGDERLALLSSHVRPGNLSVVVKAIPGITIRGRILFPDGKPAANLAIFGPEYTPHKTDDLGRFSIGRLTEADIAFRTNPWIETLGVQIEPPPGWMIEQKDLHDVHAGQTRNIGDYVLSRGIVVKGQIVDEYGQPRPNAQVVQQRAFLKFQTDNQGFFRVRVLPHRSLRFMQDDCKTVVVTLNNIKTGSIEYTLPPITLVGPTYLKGMVQNTEGEPVAGVEIRYRRTSHKESESAWSDEDGSFQIEPISPDQSLTFQVDTPWLLVSPEVFKIPTVHATRSIPFVALTLKQLYPVPYGTDIMSRNGFAENALQCGPYHSTFFQASQYPFGGDAKESISEADKHLSIRWIISHPQNIHPRKITPKFFESSRCRCSPDLAFSVYKDVREISRTYEDHFLFCLAQATFRPRVAGHLNIFLVARPCRHSPHHFRPGWSSSG